MSKTTGGCAGTNVVQIRSPIIHTIKQKEYITSVSYPDKRRVTRPSVVIGRDRGYAHSKLVGAVDHICNASFTEGI